MSRDKLSAVPVEQPAKDVEIDPSLLRLKRHGSVLAAERAGDRATPSEMAKLAINTTVRRMRDQSAC